jgi:hypothetical protein
MKKLTFTIASIALIALSSCEDTVTNVAEEESLEEMIQEFITHVETGHFNGAVHDTVAASDTVEINSVGTVYHSDFTGKTEGFYSFTHTDTVEHHRTFFSDAALSVEILEGSTVVSPEESVDLSGYNADITKVMVEYHLEPNVEYLIHISNIDAGMVSLFMAPRGLEEGEDHDHEE